MKEKTIVNDIERINTVALLAGAALCFLVTRDFRCVFSFAVGSAIVILNFRILRKILEGGLLQEAGKGKALFLVLPIKFGALATAIIVVLLYGNVNIVLFVMGLSTVILSIILAQTRSLVTPLIRRRQRNGA